MKAIVWTAYGPPEVLQLRDVPKPTPKANEVLIKVRAVLASTGDCEMRRLGLPAWVQLPLRLYVGFSKPVRITILGSYLAGDIEAVGSGVTRFAVGDAVFGRSDLNFGAYAEYVCLSEKAPLVTKPASMTYEEAAPIALGGLESLHFLRLANIQPGHKVLINGAGGSIGSYAVQLAKHFGARVTGVDSPDKLDMLRAIGADHVIDYTREDFSANGVKYDCILDVVLHSSF
jgi:NADPH:quinone reductase-like Zn-dependent oxidoreductase